jgi:hypothetical protein
MPIDAFLQAFREREEFFYSRSIVERAFAALRDPACSDRTHWSLNALDGVYCGDLGIGDKSDISFFMVGRVTPTLELWNAIFDVLQQTPSISFWSAGGARWHVADAAVIPHLPEGIVADIAVVSSGAELLQCFLDTRS